MTDETNNAAETAPQGQLNLQKIYVKDISYEAPSTPGIFTETEWTPQINLQLNTETKALDENGQYEIVLRLTVTASDNDKTAYLVEVHQAGIFTIKGFSEQDMTYMMGSYCPNILFPFAREVIASLVTHGGFPQLLLTPVNFDALLAQSMNQQDANGGDTANA
jgi:preprotein translocase subunit SecB